MLQKVLIGVLGLVCCTGAFGQQYVISTIAGNNSLGAGYSGDSGPATSAQLSFPGGIALDKSGNLYIADGGNNRVRKVSGGVITTVAGNGTLGYSGDNAAATSAELDDPVGVAVDGSGNIYIADAGNQVIREVSASGTITTFAGSNTLGAGYSGDGAAANAAQLNNPVAVAVDSSGNVYIADSGNDVIREVSGGNISTIPSGILHNPDDVAVDAMGNVYVADTGGRRIVILTGGNATVFAGNGNFGFSGDGGPATNAEFNDPFGLYVDSSGYVYIADTFNNRIRKVSADGIITTIAGQGGAGYYGDGGPATAALLYFPHHIAVDPSGNVYIADEANSVIRKLQVTPPVLSTNGVVNAANFGPQISPGALATIFGINITSGMAGATTTPLANTFAGVSVTVNGLNAPVLFVSPTQVNFQVPWETTVGSTAVVALSVNGVGSNSVTAPITTAAPGLFIYGSGRAVVQNSDFSLNTSGNPAKEGSTIMVYLTGSGPVSPPVGDGDPGLSNPLSRATSSYSAKIGSASAQATFAGLAPGFVGLVQMNIVVPTGLSAGDYPLTVTIAGQTSNSGTVSITP